jgi:hypothetical protein
VPEPPALPKPPVAPTEPEPPVPPMNPKPVDANVEAADAVPTADVADESAVLSSGPSNTVVFAGALVLIAGGAVFFAMGGQRFVRKFIAKSLGRDSASYRKVRSDDVEA